MMFNSVTSFAFTLLFLSIHLQAYNPVDRFTISCGTAGEFFDGDRTWAGDKNSILLSHQDTTVSAKAKRQFPFTDQVPYTTARLSRSQFNYSFPVSTGPKFVRLFFYPASYPSFPRTDASFTVQSNQFTLLNGFNTSLMADVENTKTIFREFMVYVNEGQRLNLSFTPSQLNSYAFINGIEVLSMPSDLYYTSANDAGFKLVGSDMLYSVRTNMALETHYRIKVGGQGIMPRNDTGLLRNWVGRDEDYLETENLKDNLPGDMDGKMNITVKPDYVAPKELYRTARDVSRNALTWEFPVDSGFYYMIRLHFCELESNISDIGDRMFSIYIASELAEERADVMRWSQKQKVLAVYKDYAVLIPKNDMQKKVNLSLQMHPYESARHTKYSGPFLNGLEIIKMNGMPVQEGKESKDSRVGVVLWVVAGIFFVLYLLLSVSSRWHPLLLSTIESSNKQNSSLPSDHCRRFSIIQIKAATKNFDDVFIIGAGGFGKVYKGYIDGSSSPVAIKRLKLGSMQGAREFMNEIEMLTQLRHCHIVPLIGYCNDDNEMILVYDFMSRGNLRDHLYNTSKPPLSWKQRLHICIGAAHGLQYLHTGEKRMIIHRDIKTTNILLDDMFVAKVSDFGLSRIGPLGKSKAHVSTAVKGSFGYLDPEYYNTQRLTEKSDVYSFGVVLFEILCARPPLIHTAETEQLSLANWARHCYQSGTMMQIVDPMLKGKIAPESFRVFCEIGVNCLLQDRTQRPSMNNVILMLEFALQLQENDTNVSVVCKPVHEQRQRQEKSDGIFNSREHYYGYKDSDMFCHSLRDYVPQVAMCKWN